MCAAVVCATSGCGGSDGLRGTRARGGGVRDTAIQAVRRPDVSRSVVSPVNEDDPDVRDAGRWARASVGELVARLARPPRTQTRIAAKVRLGDGAQVEHLWLDSLRYDGRVLSGTMNDDPVVLPGVRRGDRVRVRLGAVVDWMAVDAGRLCGGYSVRLDRRAMSAVERDAFDRGLGLVQVPTDSTPCGPSA